MTVSRKCHGAVTRDRSVTSPLQTVTRAQERARVPIPIPLTAKEIHTLVYCYSREQLPPPVSVNHQDRQEQ